MTLARFAAEALMQPTLKVLSPSVHGVLDYAVVAGFAAAPAIFGFSRVPATLAWVLAGVHLLVTLATAFPLGAVKLIPFPVHGVLETVVAVGLLALPWIGGFAAETAARNFYIGAGVVVLVVVALTNYRSEPARVPATPLARA
jgi:hypothetical protein